MLAKAQQHNSKEEKEQQLNMSDNRDRKPDKQLERQLYERFSKIVREKVLSALDNEVKVDKIDALYSNPEFNDEKKILTKMNDIGLMNGAVAGIACFAFLRWSPGAIARYLTRKRAASSAGMQSKGDVNNPFNRQSGYRFDQPPGEQAPLSSPNFVIRGIRLGLDLFVSLSIGAWSSILFFDREKMLKEAADIPLIQGRSLISEELCGDFLQEFQKFNRDTWDPNHPALSGGEGNEVNTSTGFTSMVEGFVANCKRRSIYEDELRGEQGLREDEPVLIPSPGVPRDISVSLDDLMGDNIDNIANKKSGDDEFYFDTYFGEEFQDEAKKD